MAKELKTSKYQIQKSFKSLKEKGYMKIEKYPVKCEEYDNGLYTETVAILTTNVYMPTEEGRKKIKEGGEQIC